MDVATQSTYEIDDQSWLDMRLAFEDDLANVIPFQANPKKWHPILIALRDQLADAADVWSNRKKAHDAEEIRGSKDLQVGYSSGWQPRVFSRTGYDIGMLISHKVPTAFRVTIVTYKRALAIANALLFAAESRGCKVGYSEFSSQLTIKLEDAELSFSLRERQSYTAAKVRYARDRLYEMTDRIAVCVERRYEPRFELVDKNDMRVEVRLNELFRRLYKSVVFARTASRIQKAKDELKKIQDAAYEEITRRRAIDAKLEADEQEHRRVLIDESGAWQQAQNIRAYAEHISSSSDGQQCQQVKQWSRWACGVADQMDPSRLRLADLLSNDETTP